MFPGSQLRTTDAALAPHVEQRKMHATPSADLFRGRHYIDSQHAQGLRCGGLHLVSSCLVFNSSASAHRLAAHLTAYCSVSQCYCQPPRIRGFDRATRQVVPLTGRWCSGVRGWQLSKYIAVY